MMLSPLDTQPFQPTEKAAGDIILAGRHTYRVQEDGAWTALDWPNERIRSEPSCEVVQRTAMGWFVLCGVVAGLAAFWWLVR